MFVAATISGRASAHVPVRLLIGAGLIAGGLALLLMRGVGATSSWTHLIPGLILAGVGAGMVSPPLASTAVGVVRPERAGMASGINSTFRQVGMATGIAVLGTLFSHRVTDEVRATITTVPGMSGRAAQVVDAVQSGQIGRFVAHLPARTGQAVAMVPDQPSPPGSTRSCLSRPSLRSHPGWSRLRPSAVKTSWSRIPAGRADDARDPAALTHMGPGLPQRRLRAPIRSGSPMPPGRRWPGPVSGELRQPEGTRRSCEVSRDWSVRRRTLMSAAVAAVVPFRVGVR